VGLKVPWRSSSYLLLRNTQSRLYS
jgi:hypothetical protein